MTKETIARVFLKLTLNYRAQFENAEAAAMQGMWWQMFKGYDDEVFETAAIAVINSQHRFPNVADLRKAIEELLREEVTKPKGIAGFLAEAQRSESTDFGCQCAELAKRILSGADVSADRTYMEINRAALAELGPFARELFPRVSDAVILANEREFREAKDSEEMCSRCLWTPRECTQKGFVPRLTMEPNGQTCLSLTRCAKWR